MMLTVDQSRLVPGNPVVTSLLVDRKLSGVIILWNTVELQRW